MYFRFVRAWSLAFIFWNTVFALNPLSARSLSDASIFEENPLSLDFSTPSSDQPISSPLDLSGPSTDQSIVSSWDQVTTPSLFDISAGDSNTDTSEPFWGDESGYEDDFSSILNPPLFNNDDVTLADSLQAGDCSATSEFLLPGVDDSLNKARVKRLDNNAIKKNDDLCPVPASGSGAAPGDVDPFPEDFPILRRLRELPDWDAKIRAALRDEDHNALCLVYFNGRFPWGVCSSGNEFDVTEIENVMVHLAMYGVLTLYMVWRGSIAYGVTYQCPSAEQNLFCCEYVLDEDDGTVHGEQCVLFR